MSIPNPELQLANDYVQYTNQNIFLTGKAGTGKTTFLRNLKIHSPKRMIITAPTGVAAINAGGVTIHSFFQMPFGPIVPGSDVLSNGKQRFSKDKVNIIKSLDLLVIDEISMVRADLLDGVDAVLRRYRRNNLPFGGVQLLMIGDLHQLSPVVKDHEWSLLSPYYKSYYFFSSIALKKSHLVPIELKHIYRQSDSGFIDLLNKVRDNVMDDNTLAVLNTRYKPDFEPTEAEGYITLSTHNNSADSINYNKLTSLDEKKHVFNAKVDGTFPDYTFPTSKALELKVGAQVMFVRNDPNPEKRYYNGKIGKVSRVLNDAIFVTCAGEESDIRIEVATWENIKYEVNPETTEIKETVIGSFEQYPLKLAWAITIHKSQGLTFEKAIIDARDAFAHGQVYVALSRCKTFEGLVLSTQIVSRSVMTDGTVSSFVKRASEKVPTLDALSIAKVEYQQKMLLACFDLRDLQFFVRKLMTILIENSRVITVIGVGDKWRELEKQLEDTVFAVSLKFGRQLVKLYVESTLPSTDATIIERVKKASVYFVDKLNELLVPFVTNYSAELDNKDLKKRLKIAYDELNQESAVKMAVLGSCKEKFSPETYLRAVSLAQIDLKPSKEKQRKTKALPDYSASDIQHPELFAALKQWRDEKAQEEAVPHYRIMQQKTMIQIAVSLPVDETNLSRVKGIGERSLEKYGEDLLEMVGDYRKLKGIKEVVLPVPNMLPGFDVDTVNDATKTVSKQNEIPVVKKTLSKIKKPVSSKVTYGMFLAGMTIEQIGEERGYAPSTIQGHLSDYVLSGDLDVFQFMTKERFDLVSKLMDDNPEATLSELKSMKMEFEYTDFRFTRAHRKMLEQKGNS